MKIAVHAGTLRGAGSRSVGRMTLEGLCRLDHDYLAWVPDEWPVLNAPRLRTVPVRPGTSAKFRLEALELPRVARDFGADVLLSLTDTSCPRPGMPHVLMVQQAYLAYPPSALGFGIPTRFRTKMHMMAGYFRLGMRNVDRFVVQTRDMQGALATRWGIRPDKIEVIPSCVDPLVLELASQSPHPPDGTLLCIVSPAPHKGHRFVPAILAELRSDISLSITLRRGEVPTFDAEIEELGLRHRVDYIGALGHPDFLARLRTAQVALIPSELESFGLAYYEALALGVPVVAGNTGFAREACGAAGRYASTPRAYADALESLFDPARRRHASDASRARFVEVRVDHVEIAQRYSRLLTGL